MSDTNRAVIDNDRVKRTALGNSLDRLWSGESVLNAGIVCRPGLPVCLGVLLPNHVTNTTPDVSNHKDTCLPTVEAAPFPG